MKDDNTQAERILALTMDYQRTFEPEYARNVLRHLMRKTGFLGTTFVSGDAYESAYNEGQRAIVTYICKRMKVNIKQLEKELFKKVEEQDEI